ncbi:MFS transporter [Sphingopyxis kveilinensis]|uniref:MFS transporter n=1 Tax=Sphingopyxis kveilinensis TaxID=3114367 RepID=UPI0030CD3612
MVARGERFSYAAGDTGFNLIWASIELYLLYFYIEVLALPLEIASGVFLVGAALDWLADPVIGAVADRASTRAPLRAWVLFGGPAAGIALALAFAQPALIGNWLTAYVVATHLLLRLCYSLGNIPYAALTARLTDDAEEHVRLTGLRMQGAALGGILAAIVYANVPAGEGPQRFWTGAMILGFAAQPFLLLTFLGVRERIVPSRDIADIRPFGQIRAYGMLLSQSAALRRLMVVIVTAGLSVTMLSKTLLFLFAELGHAELGYRAAIAPSLALLVSIPAWVWIEKKWGRVPTLWVALAMNALALVMAWLLYPGLVPVAILFVVAIVASCGMSVMFWSLVPAVIQDVEAARDGGCAVRIYALATTARKLGQALAPQIITLSLAFSANRSVMPALVGSAVCALAVGLLYRPVERTPSLGQASL